MHDILEGVCRYDMGRILYRFIYVNKFFKLDTLNRRIKYFDYHQNVDAGNKIPIIVENQVKKKMLIMSSAEMLALVVYFPFLCYDLVDTEDDGWSLYSLLYEILYYSMKDEFSDSEIIFFKQIIKQHNELFVNIFKEKLKPKFHFLTHYPSSIKRLGPLHMLSSMRYEGFHRVGKTNAHIVSSRVNIIKTLAIRYQLRLCYRLQYKIGLNNKFEFGKHKTVCSTHRSNLQKMGISDELHEIDWFKYNGIHFKVGCAIKLSQSDLPKFGIIRSIICTENEKVLLHCEISNEVDIDTLINAFTIKLSNRFRYVDLGDLDSIRSFHIHIVPGGKQAISTFRV